MSEALVKIGALRKALADYDAIRTPGVVLDGDAEAVITAAAEVLDVLDASLRGGAAIEATLRASLLAAERERDRWRERAEQIPALLEVLRDGLEQINQVTGSMRERAAEEALQARAAEENAETDRMWSAPYDPVRDGIPSCPADWQHVLTQDGPGWWCTGCAIGVVPVFTRLEPVTAPADPPGPCLRCSGEGQIANTEGGEAWSSWASLPPGSDLAVRVGLVQPIPCPACTGTGRRG